MSKLQSLRGTKDLLPPEYKIQQYIIDTAKFVSKLCGYEPLATPIMEFTKVFDRTLGDTSDIVSKEMYSFLDKSGESIALRPEFTASIIRAFISNGLHHSLPLKYFSYGPVFRYDRPQAGRQRQFHQLNFEHLGAVGAYTDAELIKLGVDLLDRLELKDVILEINSLGCAHSRVNYQKVLVDYFQSYQDKLSEDSKRRLLKNSMRIFDSKDESDQAIAKNAPLMAEHYTDVAKKYFDDVLNYLELLGVKYVLNPKLVRGLDYYCHTAFEFTTTSLGAQSTILAGGRYDGLAKLMGGPDTPAIGFASGIERLALMREYNLPQERSTIIMPIGDDNIDICLKLSNELRKSDIACTVDLKGKINKRIERALEKEAKYIVFIGDEERHNNSFKLKNLDEKQEYILTISELIDSLRS